MSPDASFGAAAARIRLPRTASVYAQRIARHLPRAGIMTLPEAYIARALVASWVAFGVALVIPAALAFAYYAGARPSLALWAAALAFPVAAGFGTWYGARKWPEARAPLRARAIEAHMPFAINYMATLASGRLTLKEVFGELGDQAVYGEVAEECALIHRDLNFLGKDIVGALNAAMERSPSQKWEDFLQGLLITITSGGELERFLRAKSEQHFGELRTLQRGFLDSLALLAEVFVVLVVAAPLLFLILLSILTLFGRSAQDVLLLGYALVFGMLPLTQAAFGIVIRMMTPEA